MPDSTRAAYDAAVNCVNASINLLFAATGPGRLLATNNPGAFLKRVVPRLDTLQRTIDRWDGDAVAGLDSMKAAAARRRGGTLLAVFGERFLSATEAARHTAGTLLDASRNTIPATPKRSLCQRACEAFADQIRAVQIEDLYDLREHLDAEYLLAIAEKLAGHRTTELRAVAPGENVFLREKRVARWNGVWYEFTTQQAEAVNVLFEAWRGGLPSLPDAFILERCKNTDGTRIRDIFKGHDAWDTMIVAGSKKGTRRLADKTNSHVLPP